MYYDVSKEKGGRWYVHEVGRADSPIAGTYSKDKKDALHMAADRCGVGYKEYMKLRRTFASDSAGNI